MQCLARIPYNLLIEDHCFGKENAKLLTTLAEIYKVPITQNPKIKTVEVEFTEDPVSGCNGASHPYASMPA